MTLPRMRTLSMAWEPFGSVPLPCFRETTHLYAFAPLSSPIGAGCQIKIEPPCPWPSPPLWPSRSRLEEPKNPVTCRRSTLTPTNIRAIPQYYPIDCLICVPRTRPAPFRYDHDLTVRNNQVGRLASRLLRTIIR
jgi:hypothetical protein